MENIIDSNYLQPVMEAEDKNILICEKKYYENVDYNENESDNSLQNIFAHVESVMEFMLTKICLKAKDVEGGIIKSANFIMQPQPLTQCLDSLSSIENKTGNEAKSKQIKQVTRMPVKCEICKNKSFAHRPSLLKHHRKFHQDFPTPAQNQPIKKPRIARPPSLECSYCHKVFKSIGNLRIHVRIHRPDDVILYECKFCQAKFIHYSSYKKHLCKHSDKFYKCDRCDFKTKYPTSINQHKKSACLEFKRHDKLEAVKKRKSKIPCDQCGKLLKSAGSIFIHKAHHAHNCQASIFKCKVCDKNFYQQSSLKEHEITHMEIKTFPCPSCPHKFKNKGLLNSHMRYMHLERWKCDRVGCTAEMFSSNSEFRRHRSKCEFPIPCSICEQAFPDMAAYSSHTHPIKCVKCEKTYAKKYLMDKHERFHNPLNPFKCDQCVLGFLSKGELTTHLKMTHRKDNKMLDNFIVRKLDSGDEIYRFMCKICQLEFDDAGKEELMDHVLEKHKDKLGKFICTTCGRGCQTKITLFNHRNKAHGVVETEFKCDICSTYFMTQHGVDIHKTKLHYKIPLLAWSNAGEAPVKPAKYLSKYHCSICGKKCVNELGIRRHMMSHTMDYPYKCKICTMSWSNPTYLVRHNRLRHSNLELDPVTPNHVCHHCGKRFNTFSNLESHRRSVAGEKPYRCVNCDKCYRLKSQLEFHRTAVHEPRPHTRESCDFCQKSFATKRECSTHTRIYHRADSCKN